MFAFSSIGCGILIRELPFILDGSAKEKALPQDDSKATLAPKVLCSLYSFTMATF